MNTLELFAGSCSFTKNFGGAKTLATDNVQYGDVDYVVDILDFDYDMVAFIPDVIWASPPCTAFSVASISTHWGGGYRKYEPKTDNARLGVKLVEKTMEIIEHYKRLNPNLIYFVENPRGVLRKLDLIPGTPHTVTYCQYGEERMKPTDIWTNSDWTPRPMCKNGDPCHVRAPRGAKTGTQGLKGAYLRSIVPPELIRELRASLEVSDE